MSILTADAHKTPKSHPKNGSILRHEKRSHLAVWLAHYFLTSSHSPDYFTDLLVDTCRSTSPCFLSTGMLPTMLLRVLLCVWKRPRRTSASGIQRPRDRASNP